MSTPLDDTTIVAIATPPGRGGIGVVRLSGVDAFSIAQRLLPSAKPPTPRVARYGILRDAHGKRVDDALLTTFPAPHSYTGEDVVEVATHGSPVVLDWLVRAAIAAGAQPARPGEFTERAFLRGRIDLTQAEAVRDLIDAKTLGQAQLAAQQMGGAVAAQVLPTKAALIELIATLEAGIDFAEDDIDTLPPDEITRRINALLPPLVALRGSFQHGRLMREGLRLAIVGKPNAGKSSLFNRLVERDRAIVTATPGTTRDVIAESISLGGIPVELLDTAGLRDTTDEAERIGVTRSREAIADADAVLLVIDASTRVADVNKLPRAADGNVASRAAGTAGSTHAAGHASSRAADDGSNIDSNANVLALLQDRPHLVVYNKADLLPGNATRPEGLWTSANTGEGLAELRSALLQLATGTTHESSTATLTSLRQHSAVSQSLAALEQARVATTQRTPHEMILLDLYESLRALDSLTGETTGDDILNLIFSTFCIGK